MSDGDGPESDDAACRFAVPPVAALASFRGASNAARGTFLGEQLF
jgi:hypothetical protein